MTIQDDIRDVVGPWPYRLCLAGGWIDQPLVNEHNPEAPGSVCVVSLVADFPVMERSGMATSTRRVAQDLWPAGIPDQDPRDTIRELYEQENRGRKQPSGSQDMAGLVYPGVTRLDYPNGAIYPASAISLTDEMVCRWLASVLWLVPLGPRPEGYDPLERQEIKPEAVAMLGASGRQAFEAIAAMDLRALGVALMAYAVWATDILPCHTFHHTIGDRVRKLWKDYVASFPGACYAPGGGYLIVASDHPVPGGFQVRVRRS